MSFLTRRELIAALAAIGVIPAGPGFAQSNTQPAGLKLGPARPFTFDILRDHAKKLAEKAYQPRPFASLQRLGPGPRIP